MAAGLAAGSDIFISSRVSLLGNSPSPSGSHPASPTGKTPAGQSTGAAGGRGRKFLRSHVSPPTGRTGAGAGATPQETNDAFNDLTEAPIARKSFHGTHEEQ